MVTRFPTAGWVENDPHLTARLFCSLAAIPWPIPRQSDWPYGDDSIQEFGYDMRTDQIVPKSTTDVMNVSSG
jgi:hypothetical protein